MDITFHIAATQEEREAIFRLRYEIYVEEMHIFGDVADHKNRMLHGPTDEHCRLLYAKSGDELIGSLRLNLGKECVFSDELEETYNLDLFRPEVDDAQMLILTRFMVKKEYRGSQLAYRMIEQVAALCVTEQIEIAVCDCQPHLVRYYQRMGFRSYDCEVYNDPAFGVMIPLAFVIKDLAYLGKIRSPLKGVLTQEVHDLAYVDQVNSLLGEPAITAADQLAATEYVRIIKKLSEDESSLFAGMSTKEIESMISHSYVLSLAEGDMVIREGQQTATVFAVLSGELAVRKAGHTVQHIREGEVVGELGFLLQSRRSADVCVASKNAMVLSLDENRLRKRLKSQSAGTAQLLRNLCHILASRVANRLEAAPINQMTSMMVAA